MENKVLAVVNGREITENEINYMISRVPAENKNYYSSEEGKKLLLDQVVDCELIYDYANDNKIEDNEEFKTEMENIKKDYLTRFMISKIIDAVTVIDSDCENFYNSNNQYFKTQESANAKHILVDTEEKALNIKKEIDNGLSFEDAARKYSSCPSKDAGGDLGTFTKGKMVPEFEAAAFSLSEGEISEPVKTQFGYHLIKLEKKNEQQEKKFEEVKDMIYKKLLQEKQENVYKTFVDELKTKYKVEMK